jgi:hypothetical protein
MNSNLHPIEQEAQRLICRGEDLLDRTHEVAQEIVNRVSHAMQDDAPCSFPQEQDESESAA